MKILVTGANGYLGSGVVKQLLDDGNMVIATGLTTERCDKRAVKIDSDIFTIDKPYEFFGKPDIVLHMAWRDGFVHDSDTHIIDLPKHHLFLKKLFCSNVKKL